MRVRRFFDGLPLCIKVSFCLAFFAGMLHLAFYLSESFSQAYISSAGYLIRAALSFVSGVIPISVAELLIIMLLPLLVWGFAYGVSVINHRERFRLLVCRLFSVPLVIYFMFVSTFAAGFYAPDVGTYFGISERTMTAEELYSAALICASEVNVAYSEITTAGIDDTSLGMSYDELSSSLTDAFDSVGERYGFPKNFPGRVKPIVLSEPMTYTHISGVYTFFTGEANININYPDFIIPFTAAHEMSHQRGISRENEANFVAFIVCINSDEPYIRYSGYLNMYRYMASALHGVSPELYRELYYTLSPGVREELSSYSEFFDKYRDSVAADVADIVNNAYLGVMDGTGSYSYGLVVDLAAVYLTERDS